MNSPIQYTVTASWFSMWYNVGLPCFILYFGLTYGLRLKMWHCSYTLLCRIYECLIRDWWGCKYKIMRDLFSNCHFFLSQHCLCGHVYLSLVPKQCCLKDTTLRQRFWRILILLSNREGVLYLQYLVFYNVGILNQLRHLSILITDGKDAWVLSSYNIKVLFYVVMRIYLFIGDDINLWWSSMCLEPVCAPSAVCHERNVERVGILHLLKDDALHLLFFFRKDAEVEFVVHLKYHFRLYSFGFESPADAYHGYFYYVCRRALYWGVDGVALCEVADGGVVRVDVGQIAAAVEECLRVAFCPCGLLTLLHVCR